MEKFLRKILSVFITFFLIFVPISSRNYEVFGNPSSDTIIFEDGGLTQNSRAGSEITKLNDGTVLITGGNGTNPIVSELYDPLTGISSLHSSMLKARKNHSAILLNDGRVLIVGGYNDVSNTYLASAEIYNPDTDNFSYTSEPMSTQRSECTLTLLQDGRVLIVGGYKGENTAEIFDPETDTFSPPINLTSRRRSHAASLLPDGRVLITGGQGENLFPLASAEIFNPETNTFTAINDMIYKRDSHTSTLLMDGTVLLAGGRGGQWGIPQAKAELFDPSTNTFCQIGDLTEDFYEHTATLLSNGKVLIIGAGNVLGNFTNLYDPDTQTFSRTNDITIGIRHTDTILLDNGKVFLIREAQNPPDPTLPTEAKFIVLGSLVTISNIPVGSITVNGGASSTSSKDVYLSLNASSPVTVVDEMRFSDDGVQWTGWIAYSTSAYYQLPGNDGLKTIFVEYKDRLGQISDTISSSIELNSSVGSTYNISINQGDLFTNESNVFLSIGANPYTAEMIVSNDGSFSGAHWEPYSAIKSWQITQYGDYVIPRFVYVKYKDVNGVISGAFLDDIILDVNPPNGSVEVYPAETAAYSSINYPFTNNQDNPYQIFLPLIKDFTTNVTLLLDATDDVSGVAEMIISNSTDFSYSFWIPYENQIEWFMPEEVDTVFVKLMDNAGNISDILSGSK